MAGYRVAIVGHLDIWKLPPDGSLPNEVVQVFNINAESDGKLQDWITIPLHMITHLSFRIKMLTGELSVYSKSEGKSIVPNGKDVVKQ